MGFERRLRSQKGRIHGKQSGLPLDWRLVRSAINKPQSWENLECSDEPHTRANSYDFPSMIQTFLPAQFLVISEEGNTYHRYTLEMKVHSMTSPGWLMSPVRYVLAKHTLKNTSSKKSDSSRSSMKATNIFRYFLSPLEDWGVLA